MGTSKRKKTHFVPRVVFEVTCASAIPVCVAAAAADCNFATSVAEAAFDAGDGGDNLAGDARPDQTTFTVAAIGFDGGVADVGFDRNPPDARDGGPDHPIFSVAAIGFDGGVADVGFDQHIVQGGDVAAEAFGVPADGSDAGDSRPAPSEAGDAPPEALAVADTGFVPEGGAG